MKFAFYNDLFKLAVQFFFTILSNLEHQTKLDSELAAREFLSLLSSSLIGLSGGDSASNEDHQLASSDLDDKMLELFDYLSFNFNTQTVIKE